MLREEEKVFWLGGFVSGGKSMARKKYSGEGVLSPGEKCGSNWRK